MYSLTEHFLTPNNYSRPGTKIHPVKGIVVHWVANPKTSAMANRNFFEMRKDGTKGYGSAHYLINLDGGVILDIPLDEVAYHVGAKVYKDEAVKNLSTYPNNCTLGIECTHLDNAGVMTSDTYNTLVDLTTDLVNKYRLDPFRDVYRHFDITGKDCHKWFVDNPDQWQIFKERVSQKVKNPGAAVQASPAVQTGTIGAGNRLNADIAGALKKHFKQNPAEWVSFKNYIEG